MQLILSLEELRMRLGIEGLDENHPAQIVIEAEGDYGAVIVREK